MGLVSVECVLATVLAWRVCILPGRYNCKEEFQIHDELLKAHYTLGPALRCHPRALHPGCR